MPGERRLASSLEKLFANPTKEADEAVVILMSFYLGEDNGEELDENLRHRGPRMIPILERYLREEPTSLLTRYPRAMRLERSTTTMYLKEALEILKVQAGARRISDISVETEPLRNEIGNCKPKIKLRPKAKFNESLV